MNERPVRFENYDVLSKRDSVSWNDVTRDVVDARLSATPSRSFFSPSEWRTVEALAATLLPQDDREYGKQIPIAPAIDATLAKNEGNGYRFDGVPPLQDAWHIGLECIDDESSLRYHQPFADLGERKRIELLRAVQQGDVRHESWRSIPPQRFFAEVLGKVVAAYYAHPNAWNEIGFGGPASPRGYVRLGFDQRDPWEAEELRDE